MSLPPGLRVGPYEVLSLLGKGGMGEVYRAHAPRLDRDVALKVLPTSVAGDETRARRFETEARLAARLDHPNIVAVHDVGFHDGYAFIVSELLEGETLRERLQAGPLPPGRALEYAVQIASGLAAAHDRGVVHRYLKPENLMITRGGVLKILDFGLARLGERTEEPAHDDDDGPTRTRPTDPAA